MPVRRRQIVVVVIWMFVVFALPQVTHAQATQTQETQTPSAPVPATGAVQPDALDVSICSKPSVPHSSIPVVRDLLTEFRDLTFDFCRVKEDYKDGGFSGMLDRQFGTLQDAIVDVFVGPGLHPTIGVIVPEGGVAFGAALNDEWHISETPHTRLTTSIEARYSVAGFWGAGAVSHMQFDWYRVSDNGSFRMPQVTLAVRHLDLPALPFFGLGNDSSRDDRSLFAMTTTEIPVLMDFPIGYGLAFSTQLNLLFAGSDPSQDFTNRFSDSAVPGIRADTMHLVPGLAVTYRSPEVLSGLQGEGRLSYEAFQTMTGGSFSFDRVEARVALHYGIEDLPFAEGTFPYLRSLLGSSRFSGVANLVISQPRSRSAVPFYLQPTLGGGDILNENWLRGYTSYRFRAPNTVAYGLSYERRLIDPFGFSVFAQWGKVGEDVGELTFTHLKHSIGVGLTVRLGGKSVIEFSLAWGGGEGTQVYTTGNTNNAIGFGTRAAGTVGLRGVF